MISYGWEAGGAVVDGQVPDCPAGSVEVEQLRELIAPLAERCDRLARSWRDHPTQPAPSLEVGLTQAGYALRRALSVLDGLADSMSCPR